MAGKIKQLVFAEGVTVTSPTEVDIVDTVNDQTIAGTKTFDEQIVLKEIATPTTPASGYKAVYPKADGKMYTLDDTGIETEIGSGSGGGGINYIDNPDAEGNVTTGWAVYADAAAKTPVDGTGGTANITFTASSSSPLRGTYSFLITKDAANRQGQGASYDFTIAAADKGRPLGIRWEGEASANYTGSSGTEYMVCYVYDVTNATVIATSNVNVPGGSFKGFTTFLATTSTSYRLIFHIAGTGTAAWTYKLDSVSVGPDTVVQGAAASDWISCSPTISGFSVSASTAFMRRVGDSMELIYSGTISSVSGGITIAPPSGYTIDTSKISSTTNHRSTCGQAWARDTGSAYYNGVLTMPASATYALTESSGGAGNWAATVPFTWASGDYISFHSFFPISGWSSNTTIANRAVEEFSYNSNATWDGDDYSSFGNGLAGGTITGGLSAGGRTKRVRFQNPVLATDHVELLVTDGTVYLPALQFADTSNNRIVNSKMADGTNIGFLVKRVSGSSTDFDVFFHQYAAAANDDAPAQNWISGWKWVLKKVSGGAYVGFPVSTRNIVGDTTGTTVPSGYIGEEISNTSSVTSTTSSGSADTYTAITNANIAVSPGIWLVTWSANYSSTDYSMIGVTDDGANTGLIARSNKNTGIVSTANTIGSTFVYKATANKTLTLYMKSKSASGCTVFTDNSIAATLTNDGVTHITAVRIA